MKKKILLCIAIMAMLVCVFAISVSAAEMTRYCSVKLTLTSGEEVVAYCAISSDQVKRDTLYRSIDTEEGTYSWEDVVIFDCRDQIAVGGTPKAFSGTACNAQAINVREVYLSDYFTYFLNTTFTSQWASLETVYIPSSVTELKGFSGAPVKNVIIAENSQLKTIGGSAFSGCTQLENIDISNCAYLETIANNAFQSCTSLTSITFPENLKSIGYNGFYCAGLSGTVVIPNSVTSLGAGSLLATKIETLIIGDGPITIGYNFVGSVGNTYLKEVYIPAEATIERTNTFYRCANPVNYYIVGEDPDALVETLLGQQSDRTYATFITADQADDTTGAGYGIIYTGYNRCEYFYGDVHAFDEDGVESCVIICDRCKLMVPSGGAHIYGLVEEFTGDVYVSSGAVKSLCTVCGDVESEVLIDVIITCLGYSASEMGTSGIAIGYAMNSEAVELYESTTGKSFNYGAFVASEAILGQEDVLGVQGAVCVDVKRQGLSMFELKVVGFTDAIADSKFALGAYIAVSKDGAVEYTYVQNTVPTEGKYSYDSFNGIMELLGK